MKRAHAVRVAEDGQNEHSLLVATLEATADGILVVDATGKITRFNERFAQLWRIPKPILDAGDDEAAIGFVLGQLRDPDEFLSQPFEMLAPILDIGWNIDPSPIHQPLDASLCQ